MAQKKICLASENWSPAHPSVLQAVIDANAGVAMAYGADAWSEKAEKLIQQTFQSSCKVFFVPTGTGANVLALKLACRSHESVICSDLAHIHYHESGAAEAVVGCKVLAVPHENGKITPERLLRALRHERAFGKHSTSPRVLSIAQPTEVGTLYSLEELEILSKLCREEHLLLHIDGSRIYNAVVGLKIGLADFIHAIPVDLLSLGGTKNGLMGAEALLVFNSSLLEGADHIQKQTLQLLSKMRYLTAQYIPFFEHNLWFDLASVANQRARQLAAIIEEIPELSLSYPVETNQVFFTTPESWIPVIQEGIICYPWDHEKSELRFIASWNTSEDEIDGARAVLHKVAQSETVGAASR